MAKKTLHSYDLLGHLIFIRVALNDLIVQAVKSELKPVRDAQLVIDFAQVVFDHLLRGAQLKGNFLVALALG